MLVLVIIFGGSQCGELKRMGFRLTFHEHKGF